MPRPPRANALIRDTRREEILRAAVRVFAERGIRDATISEIAKAAGLSHGLIYHYFTSKDALIEALFEQKLEQMREIMSGVLVGDGPVLERIERACEAILHQTDADPDLAMFITQAIMNRACPEPMRERLSAHGSAALEQLTQLIAEGQRRGEIANDAAPESLATATAALIRGLSLLYEVPGTPRLPPPPPDVITRLLRPAPPAPCSGPPPSPPHDVPRKGNAPVRRKARK
jgi:AcrR family transcriptional regulator